MGKKQKKHANHQYANQKARQSEDKQSQAGGASLKDLLDGDTLAKLKAQAEQAKQEEANKRKAEAERKAEEERAERKRLENDFSYLLENSDPNWSKYK